MASTIETIGKSVVSLADGKTLGVVGSIEIKNQKVKNLVVLAEGDEAEYLFVPLKNVYAFGGEVTTLKSTAGIAVRDVNVCPRILGAVVINQTGEKVFVVADVLFDEKTGKITHLIDSEKNTQDPSQIASIDNNYVLLKGEINTTQRRVTKKITPKSKQTAPVLESSPVVPTQKQPEIIQPVLTISQSIMMPEPQEKLPPLTPSKIVCDYAFLIGRRLISPLFDNGGKMIIASGEKLTAKNLGAAIASGNLNSVLRHIERLN